MKTQKVIDKSTCKYAPLTYLQDSNLSDEQIMDFVANGNTNGIERMQIDDKNSDESINFDMKDDEDDDNGLFSFQQQYKFVNLEQIFPDTPARNIGPQRNGSTLASLTSGVLDAMGLNVPDETKQQTGDNQNV